MTASPIVRARRTVLLLVTFAVAVTLAGVVAAVVPTAALGWTPIWTATYAGPDGTVSQTTTGVAAAPDGSVYIAGYATHTLFVSDVEPFLVKCGADGTQLWSRTLRATGIRRGSFRGVTVDPAGRVYAWGSYGRDEKELLVARYRADGRVVWATRIPGDGSGGRLLAAVADGEGGLYVAGTASRGSGMAAVVARIGPRGGVGWRRYVHPTAAGWDTFLSIDLDARGRVYVAGNTETTIWKYGWVVASYAPDGRRRWIRRPYSRGDDSGTAFDLTIAPGGRVYVVGGGNGSAALCCFRLDGSPGFSEEVVGDDLPDTDVFAAVALDASGAPVCAGHANCVGATSCDLLVAGFDADGARRFIDVWDGPAGYRDFITGVAVAPDGQILIAGQTERWGMQDFVVLPYSATGQLGTPMIYDAGGLSCADPHAAELLSDGYVVAGESDYRDDGAEHALTVVFPLPPSP